MRYAKTRRAITNRPLGLLALGPTSCCIENILLLYILFLVEYIKTNTNKERNLYMTIFIKYFCAFSLLMAPSISFCHFSDAVGSLLGWRGQGLEKILRDDLASKEFDIDTRANYPTNCKHPEIQSWTLLMIATGKGNLPAVQLLVDTFHANKDLRNNAGQTAADIARTGLTKHPIYGQILNFLTSNTQPAGQAGNSEPAGQAHVARAADAAAASSASSAQGASEIVAQKAEGPASSSKK